MENNNLKEKIRKNVKEEIAISNIRKEFDMKTNKSKKIIYIVSSVCAVLILCIGIFVGVSKLNNNLLKNDNVQLGEAESEENNLDVVLNINKLKELAKTSLDLDIKTREMESLPEKFKFIESANIPEGYKLESSYNIYVRDDDNNIRCYNNILSINKDAILSSNLSIKERELKRREILKELGYGYDEITGEVELLDTIEKQIYLDELVPTEKNNRNAKHDKMYSYGRRR